MHRNNMVDPGNLLSIFCKAGPYLDWRDSRFYSCSGGQNAVPSDIRLLNAGIIDGRWRGASTRLGLERKTRICHLKRLMRGAPGGLAAMPDQGDPGCRGAVAGCQRQALQTPVTPNLLPHNPCGQQKWSPPPHTSTHARAHRHTHTHARTDTHAHRARMHPHLSPRQHLQW